MWKEIILSRIDNLDEFDFTKNETQIVWNIKFFKENFIHDWNTYQIITKKDIDTSIYDFIKNYVYFLFFTFPFIIVFYFLWYFFIWKNLKPIEENIGNLEDFVWNINHEFKTPLSEIISSLELSKKTWKYEDAINKTLISTNKLSKILNSIVWIVSLTNASYKKENVDLLLICKNIIKNYKKDIEEKNIKINLTSTKKIPSTKMISEHFEICFSNLLSNSIKYSNKDWKIDINLGNDNIIIQDNWVWIEKENLDKIFNRYFRESYIKDWSWIGLSIVKKIVEINWWKINIDSEKDIWTKIEIIF